MRKASRGTDDTRKDAIMVGQGISMDFGLIVQRSKDPTRFKTFVGLNGETAYLLIADHFSDFLWGIATTGKSPSIAWINHWFSQCLPGSTTFWYAAMDEGCEMACNPDVLDLLKKHDYIVRPTAPDSSFQNAPSERPHSTIADALRTMLHGAILSNKLWPFAFNYYLLINRFLPHGDRGIPCTRAGGGRGDISKLRTLGCLVMVCPPGRRYGKLEQHCNSGFFLGYPLTFAMIYYWDLDTKCVNTAYSVKFDEAGIAESLLSPNVRRLRDALDNREITDETLEVQAPAHIDLHASGCPFTRLKTVTLPVCCTHPTFGILVHDCAARQRAFIAGMDAQITGASLRGWKRHYAGAYVVEINGCAVFNALEFGLVCAHVRDDLASTPSPHITLTLAPERAEAMHHTDVSSRMRLDQFRPVIHILHKMGEDITLADTDLPDDEELVSAICSVVRDGDLPPDIAKSTGLHDTSNFEAGTQPGSKWTRRQLRKLPCWSQCKSAETKQLNSLEKDGMYGPPCKPPHGGIIL
jgi:hypothetical protein